MKTNDGTGGRGGTGGPREKTKNSVRGSAKLLDVNDQLRTYSFQVTYTAGDSGESTLDQFTQVGLCNEMFSSSVHAAMLGHVG